MKLPKNFHITKAKITDLPALLCLEHACFKSDLFSKKQYRYLILSRSIDIFLIKKSDHLIAKAIVLYRRNSSVARLYSIAVHPDYQSRGIARLLCQYIEIRCHKRRLSEIRLEVRKDNKRAIRFYQKIGYVAFGERKKYYEDGEDAIRMVKNLK